VGDPDLEDLLQRYRPLGPSPELRARSLSPAHAAQARTWPWAAAAAALLVLTGSLHVAVSQTYSRIDVPPAPDPIAEAVASMTELLGSGPEDRAVAEAIVAEQAFFEARDSRVISPKDMP
jgi:hypothetical protein